MPKTTPSRQPYWRSRWWMPSFSMFLGVLILAAFWAGGEPGLGLGGLALFTGIAALFLFGSARSETLSGLGGTGRDERWAMIDLHATALAGLVLVVYVIGAWLWEVAHGEDGEPYSQMGAIAGLAYLLAVAFLRWRS
jgi:hypothetical protein